MDRKGSVVGLGILPVFAFVVFVASLFVFFSYDNHMAKPMADVTNSIKMTDLNEAYITAEAKIIAVDAAQTGLTKDSFAQAALSRDVHLSGQGNFFVLVSTGQFNIAKRSDSYILSMPALFVLGQTETATIKRNIDLEMEFDAKGEFIRFINK